MMRHLLIAGWLVMLMSSLNGAAARAAGPVDKNRRPNFVFFLIDDLRHDAMSCAGHPFIKTPHIDKLAASGVRFTHAFVTLSLCAPSRATFLTGVYGHLNGVPTNEGQELDTRQFATYPMLLQKAGYETGFIGKWHMAPQPDPRPGFDYWLSFKGQGIYENPELNENGRSFTEEGYITDILTDRAVAFLKKERTKPFSLCIWHKAVHAEFTPAKRHRDLYANDALPEPESFRDTLEGKPAWQRAQAVWGAQQRKRRAGSVVPAAVPPAKWDGRERKKMDYFRAEAAVDESVGRVLQTLGDLGQLANTYIIFAGDNGFFHGEHRRGDKRAAYEESILIPFLIQGPGIDRPGRIIDQMVLNLDVAPTILELAGVKPAPTMQGRSIKPLLAGHTPADWRTSFFYEYFREKWLPGIPTMLAVRTTDWKYVTYPGLNDLDELYDLARDPHEMYNLALDRKAAPRLAEMKREFERLKKETRYREVGTRPAQ